MNLIFIDYPQKEILFYFLIFENNGKEKYNNRGMEHVNRTTYAYDLWMLARDF